MPLPAGQYTVGCSIDCYAGHTGQDFGRGRHGRLQQQRRDHSSIRSTHRYDRYISYRNLDNGRCISYGNLIVVRDANPSIEVYYAHLSRREDSEGPHLHTGFESMDCQRTRCRSCSRLERLCKSGVPPP